MRFTFALVVSALFSTVCFSKAMNEVQVTGGRIAITQAVDGVRAYKGLPYAAPPVGELR